MQTLKSHKHGINQGLTPAAKKLLYPVATFTQVAPIINGEGERVDWLRLIACKDGRTFVEVVDLAIEHRGGISVYFVSLIDRFGIRVPESAWTTDEMRAALIELEDNGTVEMSVMLHRGAAPPTSYSLQ
jgi:hypothetical protein